MEFSSNGVFCRSSKGIKNGRKKTRIPFDSNFILGGLRLFCGEECFPGPVEILGFPQIRCLKRYHGIILSKLQVWGPVMCLCVQWVGSPETATSRRQNTLLSRRGSSRHVCSLLTVERERSVRLGEVVKVSEAEFLLGARKPIFSSIRKLRFLSLASRKTYFCRGGGVLFSF